MLVAHDVNTETASGHRRLRRVAQVCLNDGQRVQKSVFEWTVNEAQYERLIRDLLEEIDPSEDSLRIYRPMEPEEKNVREFGVFRSIDFEGPLIF